MHSFSYQRITEREAATGGRLFGPSGYLCDGLEDAYHPVKIPGQTRIPAGTFELELYQSPRFSASYSKRLAARGLTYHGMILLKGVPGFSYVLIHCGNDVKDTDGCLIVGDRVVKGLDGLRIPVGETWPAFYRIYPILSAAILGGGASLQVLDLP